MMLSAGHPDAQDSIAPGVPATLAQERAQRLKDVEYRLHFSVPASAKTPVTGSVVIAFTLADVTGPVVLDFAGPADSISDARTLAGAFQPQVRDEHIVIPASMLRAGANEVRLSFVSSDLALNRNPEFLYTLFVPARARLAFPCFDQPDLKARYTLTLDVPAGWQALANGAETGARRTRRRRRRSASPRRSRSPTYLFAFAAGRFQVETAERNGRTFRMFHRETDAAKVARNRDAIFDLHAARARLARATTPAFRIRSASSTSCWCRRSSSAAWSIRARSSTTPRRCCSTVRDAEPEARTRQPDRARDRAHVVRRSRDDAVVRRRVDEGGVRQLHGGEDREPVVPGDQPRAALPLRALSRRLRRRPHRGHQRDPPAARQPERGRQRSTARSSTRRRRSSCASSR